MNPSGQCQSRIGRLGGYASECGAGHYTAERNQVTEFQKRTSLSARFACAFRGIGLVTRQKNMLLHSAAAVIVFVFGALFRLTMLEWTIIALCTGVVMTAECFNSALEAISPAITKKYDEHIRDALDIAAGSVLLAAMTAAVIGCLIFARHLPDLLSRI